MVDGGVPGDERRGARAESDHDDPGLPERPAAGRVVHDARRGGDDGRSRRRERVAQDSSLAGEQRGDPVLGRDRSSVASCGRKKGRIAIDERHAEPARERGADRRLARPHEPDEHDVPERGPARRRGPAARSRGLAVGSRQPAAFSAALWARFAAWYAASASAESTSPSVG